MDVSCTKCGKVTNLGSGWYMNDKGKTIDDRNGAIQRGSWFGEQRENSVLNIVRFIRW